MSFMMLEARRRAADLTRVCQAGLTQRTVRQMVDLMRHHRLSS